MKPKIRSSDGLMHLSYRTPNQIYCSAVYPRLSPEGCELILCGHERGLLILRRGKQGAAQTVQALSSNQESEDPMVVDDAGGPDEDTDQSQSYRPIQSHIDLPLGVGVRHIACLRLPQSKLQDSIIQPVLLRENVVVGLACEDNSIRLLAFPLSLSWGKLGESLLKDSEIGSTIEHWPDVQLRTLSKLPGISHLPKGISLALSSLAADESDTGDSEDSASENEAATWELLVAHHSNHVSGRIHVQRLRLSDMGHSFDDNSAHSSLTIPLSSPASSVEIVISNTLSGFKLAKILASFNNAPIRIYEYPLDSDNGKGKWTLTISPGVEATPDGSFQYKAVAHACWGLGGHVILALLVSGEWFLCDVSTRKSTASLQGVLLSKPVLSGKVGYGSPVKVPKIGTAGDAAPKMAPMTPGTRQSRQDVLFHGHNKTSSSALGRCGITMALLKRASSSMQDTESALIWSGNSGVVIPDLAAYWRNRGGPANDPFRGAVGSQGYALPQVTLDGETCTGASLFVRTSSTPTFKARNMEILFTGQLSIIILAPLRPQARSNGFHAAKRLPAAGDGSLLASGELDVGGLDRMLDVIENNTGSALVSH